MSNSASQSNYLDNLSKTETSNHKLNLANEIPTPNTLLLLPIPKPHLMVLPHSMAHTFNAQEGRRKNPEKKKMPHKNGQVAMMNPWWESMDGPQSRMDLERK